MKKHLLNRILALALVCVMVVGMFPAVSAAPAGLRWIESDVDVSLSHADRLIENVNEPAEHLPTDVVRVSIVLEDAPTVQAGYATMGIASNTEAMSYDRNLLNTQQNMAKTISVQALDGKKLDVVWNLTLVSNIISANVPYGKIEAIKAIEGVKNVVIERQYETTEAEKVSPNMYTSSAMIGSSAAWQSGLTGAGTRVAIIDTGTDTDHQSFDNGAYLYALEQNAAAKQMSVEEYVASLDLLDAQEIGSVLEYLNASEYLEGVEAADCVINEKLPFGFNYIDHNLKVTHDDDEQGEHGSHVAGIAAANRYIEQNGAYVSARDTVRMSGVAPDAQILTMKVFGENGGAFDSDYFAAIEDAIWLGADSVNLSLGSGNPGTSVNTLFADLLDFLTTTDTVVVMSAGNSGYWAESSATGYLYNDGVSFDTAGSPGSYTNSLGVASVDNDGTVGKYIQVGEHMIVYTETTGYANAPMTTLDKSADGKGTEYDYVFVDGFGVAEDYAGIDLTGKVVFCSRGSTSFFEKGNVAASLGAAAVVICNNQAGVINMDLTGYTYSAPCVSILQTDGAAVKAASTKQTTEAGLEYYTGKVTVASEMGVTQYNSEYYTMSSFSSWGVPGTLEMKPEITAPGGLIWSVWGSTPMGGGSDQYELMSGTSMAAPQVTGMAALVAEYIKANGLDEQTGLSVRELSQSLLMSTAEPLREGASGGEYYSILNQGAGLARVDLATTAESYVLVDGMADGKVKVELYDDPDRVGEYAFSFSINNLNGEAMTYALSADLFTQDVFDGGNGILYLDTWTRTLPVEVTFSANGVSLENTEEGFECDLNGDGKTSVADADYLLEYLLGNEAELYADGDVNGDGKVNTYDAHVLLTKQTNEFTVDVPADGSVTVDVELKLTDEVKAFFDAYYPTGAYVESYVYAEPVTDGEGKLAVTHSIPVLGYYGSWTEPSMYDVGSYLEYAYGEENRAPYLYAVNGIQSNFMSINYGDGDEYLFGGNPFAAEDAYLPDRNAFNNENGAMLQKLYFSLIRNATATMFLIEDADTGDIYLAQELGEMDGAYYHVNGQAWKNTQKKLGLGLDLAGIPEGTRLNLSLVAAPEMYCYYDYETETYYTDWESLAEGAYLTTSLTIDNTAPELKSVKLGENNTLTVTAKDNEYVAAVALLNTSGSAILTATAANQTERATEVSAELDLSAVFGEKFLVAVFDYAENVAVYEITLELDNERPYFTASDAYEDKGGFIGMNADGTFVALTAADGIVPVAAEYVDGYVFQISDSNDLFVSSDDDLYEALYLGNLDAAGEWGMFFNDLAYNKADGMLYGNFYSMANYMAAPYLCTINPFTGEMKVLGELPVDANSMTIDGAGNFYAVGYGTSALYTFKSDVVETQEYKLVGQTSGYSTEYYASMAWDHNTNELYWACTDGETTDLLKINPETAEAKLVSTYDFCAVGLYIAWDKLGNTFAPTDKVASITVDAEAATLVKNTVQLEARVLPWNVSDSTVTWTSNNESVATVDDSGLVYGVAAGEAVITVTSKLDPTKSASCTVTVSALDKDLKGLVWDEEGYVWWSEFNTDTLPDYTKLEAAANNLPVNATMVANGKLYASTLDTSSGLSDLYTVNPETFEMTRVGGSAEIAYTDLAYAPSLGYGMATYFNYIVIVDLATGEYMGAWDWTGGSVNLVGITYYGSQYNSYYGAYMDMFLILDADGNVYLDAFMPYNGGYVYFNGPEEGLVGAIGDPVDYSYFQGFYYDGSYAYWTRFNEADNVVELIAWDCDNSGNAYSMGCFPEGVWPVGGLYSDAEFTGTNALVDEALATATFKNSELMTHIEPVELKETEAKGSLNAAIINTTPVVKPDSTVDVEDFYGVAAVQMEITMPEDTTNGIFTVAYDPEKLFYVGMDILTDVDAYTEEEGAITVAYADGSAIAAGETVGIAYFLALTTKNDDTSVTVTTTELNEGAYNHVEELPVVLPHTCPSAHFVDVSENQWFHEAVDYVVQAGYMNGMDATHFGPDLTMTRAQFVTVLHRMEGEPEAVNTGVFEDVPEDYYTEAVYWALENGITTGATETTFKPHGKLTRSELVTFMYRYAEYCGFINDKSDDLSGYTDAASVPEFSEHAWQWAVANGIIQGMTTNTLAPAATSTRAQAATIFQRYDTYWLELLLGGL